MLQPDKDGSSPYLSFLITLLKVVFVLCLGFVFLSPYGFDTREVAARIAFHNLIFPSSVAFNTTTIDPNVTLTIGPNRTETGVESHDTYYYSDNQFGLKISNTWNSAVRVNGKCTYVDGQGTQISSISFPEIYPSYEIPAYGTVGYMTMIIPLTQSHTIPNTPPSTENGTITCSIQNVSFLYPS